MTGAIMYLMSSGSSVSSSASAAIAAPIVEPDDVENSHSRAVVCNPCYGIRTGVSFQNTYNAIRSAVADAGLPKFPILAVPLTQLRLQVQVCPCSRPRIPKLLADRISEQNSI